ncbi:MAG: hypothetical protein DELT_00712 [Desulfovibrio sp.]
MTKKRTIVVIGGGVSGMTSALILASFGHEVSLIECSPALGLTVRGFFREGVYFDTGLHYTGGLGEGGALRRYLTFLGLGDLPAISFDREGFDTVRFYNDNKEIRLHIGFEAMRGQLRELFPGEEKAIDEYFDEARNVFVDSPLINGTLNIDGVPDIRKVFEEESRFDTLDSFLRERTNNELLYAVLSIHTLLHGSAPDEVSFRQHARVAASYFDSVHTFSGGGRALVNAFERQLAAKGVAVTLGKRVTGINFSYDDKGTGVIEGVTLDDDSMLDADTVVYTGHPHYLPDLVPPGLFKPAFVRRMRHLEDTPSAYMLFGIAEEPLFSGSARNLFLCPDTDLSAFFKRGDSIDRGPYYVTTSPAHTRLAHTRPHTGTVPGKSGTVAGKGVGITALTSGDFTEFAQWKDTVPGRRGKEYEAFKAAKLERFREGLVRACPELANVRFIEGATPLTFRDYTHSPSGSLYGCKHTLDQYNPQPVTRVPHLWLAGQSVVAPGVFGAVISAFLACGFIVGPEKLQEEVGACV